MAGNDLRVAARNGQRLFTGADHAADGAARAFVDERVDAVEPDVAHVQHIRLLEMNEDVRVGVRGGKVDQAERVAIVPDAQSIFKGD